MRGIVAVILLAAAALTARGADFSGVWKMDPERSESAHQEGPVTSATIEIRMNGNNVTMETTRAESSSDAVFHETLTFPLNGAEVTATGHAGAEVKGKAKIEGAKLVVETGRNINGATVTTTYVHTLSKDGKTMTVDKTLSVQHGYQGQAGVSNTGHGQDLFVRVSK